MKKLILTLSLFITSNLFAQAPVNTGQKITIKVGGGGSADLTNYFTKGQIDSINAGYYTKSQVDSIVATINATVHINNSAEITYTGTGTSGNPFVFSIDSLNVSKLNGGKIDTAHIPISTIHIVQIGSGQSTLRGSNDSLFSSNISGAGTVTVTKGLDSGIVITGTGSSGGNADSLGSQPASYYLPKGDSTIANRVTVNTTNIGTNTTAITGKQSIITNLSDTSKYVKKQDSTVVFTTPYQSSLKQNISDSITKYVTPTQLVKKTVHWYNVLNYGASPSNSSSVNTTAINACFAAALVDSGTAYIPAGIYLVDSLIWNPHVAIVGDGAGSILKSNSAVTLLSYNGVAGNIIAHNNTISNITLDGNNIGTVGLYTNFMSEFTLNNVYMTRFTQYGAHLYRTLIGSINNCSFLFSKNGLYLEGDVSMRANLITINTCRMSVIPKVGLKILYGAGILVNSADFESCGTIGDSTTGAISVSQMSSSLNDVSMYVKGGWFEANNGTEVNIGSSNYVTNYIFSGISWNQSNNAQYGVIVANGATVYLNNCLSTPHTINDVQVNNFDSKVVLNNTIIGNSKTLFSYQLLKQNTNYINVTDSSNTGVWVNITNRSANPTAEARLLLNNNVSGASFYKPSSTYSGYRNTAANDLVIYNSGGNISVLQDNTAGNINFSITSTNALTMTNNSIQMFGGNTYFSSNGRLHLGAGGTPTATLQLQAGIAAAGGQPIQYTAGVLSTTPVSGEVGTDATNNLYYTNSSGIRARQGMWAYKAVTTTYTATDGDYTIDCTTGTFTVTLPTAVGIAGRVYTIINSGSGTVTIATTSSQTFTNYTATPTTLVMATLGTYQVQSTGSNWIVISKL